MKYIKSFNEDLHDKNINIEYLNDIFLELRDSGFFVKIEEYQSYRVGKVVYGIKIDIRNRNVFKLSSIYEVLSHAKSYLNSQNYMMVTLKSPTSYGMVDKWVASGLRFNFLEHERDNKPLYKGELNRIIIEFNPR